MGKDTNPPPPDNVCCDINWVFPVIRNPPFGRLWNVASNVTIYTVGSIARICICWLNRTRCHNVEPLLNLVVRRPPGLPLISVANHISRFDDPGLWGCSTPELLNQSSMRWTMAGHDICFTSKLHSYFFLLGKCIPIVRGNGIYQESVNFCIERLKLGEWIHLFPQGRINVKNDIVRLKWGIGRMIYESTVTPVIVPIWIVGMETVFPMNGLLIPRIGHRVTFNFGNPVDLTELIKELRETETSAEESRRLITERVQIELFKLKDQTEALHCK